MFVCALLTFAISSVLSQSPAIDLAVVGAGGSSPTRISKPHSFSSPYGGSVPFWHQGGTTTLNDEYIHLTSTAASSTGSIWNSEPNLADDWEVEVGFKVSGARYLGGDGFAFWYAKPPFLQYIFVTFGQVHGQARHNGHNLRQRPDVCGAGYIVRLVRQRQPPGQPHHIRLPQRRLAAVRP